ncbi:MAG: hypothetical protein PHI27_10625 [Eubacteriales bacterium]|nr:hypothetical protein [Eubacteriales bacterium]MDD4512733.1 hypothetical protein [Eubacteriales bacterium]
MPENVVDFRLPAGDRAQKREALICCFMSEAAGTGKDDCASRYRYNVESYCGYTVFLKRPTQLNKGFDFTVNIHGMHFKKVRRYSNPSHQDIFDALACCKYEYPHEYEDVRTAIFDIFDCRDSALPRVNAYFRDSDGSEHPIQIILLAIKWLFMEQDCAYWNYSGR